jgi:hypothetical protein
MNATDHDLCDHVDPPLTFVDLRHHVAARTMVKDLEDVEARPRSAQPADVPADRREIPIATMVVARLST